MPKKNTKPKGIPVIEESAAGVDIGSRFHVVAVNPDKCKEPVRTFQAFTEDLKLMANWLLECGVKTVAMESTGVYWVPVYEVLEEHGFEVVLVNARNARNVPGRKTDVNDAQWLQRLHSCGLLQASFRPDRMIAALRVYLRLRERHLDYAASHIQHMQKAMTLMNLQLHHVVTDITGMTGMRIIRAIISGERDPDALATMRDVRCKAAPATIRAALTGNYQPEHLFALSQAVTLYDFYQTKVAECDAEIERAIDALTIHKPVPAEQQPRARHKTKAPNALAFDVRAKLYHLLGVDLTQIHGVGPYLALRLVSECGCDLSKWKTAKHFTSWLALSPGRKISGGKVLSAYTRKTNNRVTSHLRLAAVTVGRTSTALGAFYRRLAARIGKAKAVTATSRKIAIHFYNAMRYGISYVDQGAEYYEQRYKERVVKNLQRKAAELGFRLEQTLCVS